MRRYLAIFATTGLAMMLVSCDSFLSQSESYRYKLTITLDTPSGLRTAASVREVTITQPGKIWKTLGGCGEGLRAEALYLDLGAGRRPLIAMLGIVYWQFAVRRDRVLSPTRLLMFLSDHERKDPSAYYGQIDHCVEQARRLRSIAGVYEVRPYDLPDLVTFGDITDRKTVMSVDPEHLDATLGPGVTLRAATIQITNEPVTTGLEQKLPWLKMMTGSSYLDGESSSVAANTSLANKLQRADFIFPYPIR